MLNLKQYCMHCCVAPSNIFLYVYALLNQEVAKTATQL